MVLSPQKTLLEDINSARKEGFTIEFYFKNNKIYCRNSSLNYTGEQCYLVEYCRHEGMSDPSDSSILFLIECKDGSKGYLSSAYGIYADTDTIDFVLSLKLKDSK